MNLLASKDPPILTFRYTSPHESTTCSLSEFMDKDDLSFREFNVTLDNSLRADGVGVDSMRIETITSDEEDQLWRSGVLSVDSPKGLLRCVFFYNGKCFCLRDGGEHRDLCISWLQRLRNPDRYVYSEKSSKNGQGGLLQSRLDHKTVTITTSPSVGNCCHVLYWIST